MDLSHKDFFFFLKKKILFTFSYYTNSQKVFADSKIFYIFKDTFYQNILDTQYSFLTNNKFTFTA